MRTVWKYDVPDEQAFTLDLPAGAVIRHTDTQDGVRRLWAEVDQLEQELRPRRFAIVGTGHPIPEYATEHVDTWQAGPFIWHLYAERAAP